MTRYCQGCGTPYEDGAKFCQNCGASLESDPVAPEQVQETEPITVVVTKPKMSTGKKVVIAVIVIVALLIAASVVIVMTSEKADIQYDYRLDDAKQGSSYAIYTFTIATKNNNLDSLNVDVLTYKMLIDGEYISPYKSPNGPTLAKGNMYTGVYIYHIPTEKAGKDYTFNIFKPIWLDYSAERVDLL